MGKTKLGMTSGGQSKPGRDVCSARFLLDKRRDILVPSALDENYNGEPNEYLQSDLTRTCLPFVFAANASAHSAARWVLPEFYNRRRMQCASEPHHRSCKQRRWLVFALWNFYRQLQHGIWRWNPDPEQLRFQYSGRRGRPFA